MATSTREDPFGTRDHLEKRDNEGHWKRCPFKSRVSGARCTRVMERTNDPRRSHNGECQFPQEKIKNGDRVQALISMGSQAKGIGGVLLKTTTEGHTIYDPNTDATHLLPVATTMLTKFNSEHNDDSGG